MNMMNASSPMIAALLRSLYSAVIAGAIAGLTASQTGSSDRDAVIVGVLAALSILSTRGLVEGTYDQHRDDIGAVKGSDVTSNP